MDLSEGKGSFSAFVLPFSVECMYGHLDFTPELGYRWRKEVMAHSLDTALRHTAPVSHSQEGFLRPEDPWQREELAYS